MSLEFSMQEVEQLKADNADLSAKYDVLVVRCERLVDENEQLKAYKEHLTEEMDRIAILCEQGR